MDEMSCKPKVKHKISCTVEAGFKCDSCGWETVSYDGSQPPACLNCGVADPRPVWKDIIKNVTTVETVKL